MRWLPSIAQGLRRLLRWDATRNQTDEELRSYFETSVQEKMRDGMSREAAWHEARVEMGSIEAAKESVADVGWEAVADSLWRDLRYAVRTLRRSPAFASVAVLILALGIGANTAIFGLMDALLIRSLPVSHPEELVLPYRVLSNGRLQSDFLYPIFEQFRDRNRSFSGIFALDSASTTVRIDGQPEMASTDFVSGNYFDVFGVQAIAGRTLTPADDQPGNSAAAVISYSYWQRRFAHDVSIIGKTIYAGGIPFTVVGITPATFFGTNVGGRSADLYLPMTVHPQLGLKDHDTYDLVARLRPGVSRQQAQTDLDVIFHEAVREGIAGISPQRTDQLSEQHIEVVSGMRGSPGLSHEYGGELRILMAVVAIGLLIASLNVMNMLLARARWRRKDVALRIAIGASRRRVIRQLFVEALLLSACAAIAGFFFARWGAAALAAFLSMGRTSISLDLTPDVYVLLFTCGITLGAACLFGVVPALEATRVSVNEVLKFCEGSEGRSSTSNVMRALVVCQIALSLALLAGAGLLARSLLRLHRIDTGFNRDKVLVGWIAPVTAGYDHAREMSLYRELLVRLNTIPGIEAATLSRYRLMFARPTRDLRTSPSNSQTDREVYCYPVAEHFFEVEGIRLLRGRAFTAADGEASPKVAVISESVARQFFGGKDAAGMRLGFDKSAAAADFQIVGIAKDIQPHLREQRPLLAVYIPYTQAFADDYGQMTLALRTKLEPQSLVNAVRRQVASLDKNLPVTDLKTQAADTDEDLSNERSLTTLVVLFGISALALASLGLYGTLSYAISRRTRELGIRTALGAERNTIARLILRESFLLTVSGIVLGIPAALIASRFVANLLFGVGTADLVSFSIASGILLLAALAASYFPARRAAVVDPVVALRYE
jgi:predicted permease